MDVYLAICNTVDPDTGVARQSLLGIYSTLELAKQAFTRTEERVDGTGDKWQVKHGCFRGKHSVEKFELDGWCPLGI